MQNLKAIIFLRFILFLNNYGRRRAVSGYVRKPAGTTSERDAAAATGCRKSRAACAISYMLHGIFYVACRNAQVLCRRVHIPYRNPYIVLGHAPCSMRESLYALPDFYNMMQKKRTTLQRYSSRDAGRSARPAASRRKHRPPRTSRGGGFVAFTPRP